MKPGYFDLTVRDVGAARRFFEALFGWQFEPFAPGYWRIRTGPPDEAGIDGGMGRVADAPLAAGRPMTVLVVSVEDLDERVRLVERSGGQVLERRVAIPGVGWFASCAEPGGLVFGMIQPEAPADR